MAGPKPPDPPDPGERLVLVHVTTSAFEAYALRGLLEAEGIPVFLKGESEGPYRMAFAPSYLYVPATLEVQARLLLAEAAGNDERGRPKAPPPETPDR